jgi:predicted PurR-regulated permease PerM
VFSVILGIQILDALFVTPKIIGGRLGLHPVISIAAIISLGGVFGFWGVMLAIPSAALIQQAWRGLIPLYIDSKFYRE